VPEEEIGKVAGDLFESLPDFDLPLLQAEVVRLNALPRAAAAEVARAQWALDRARVQPIPNVNLMGGYQREINYPPSNQGLFQVALSVPLFDRNQGNIRAAQADISVSRATLRTIELDLATKTAQTVNTYRISRRLAAWYEESILPKARETVALTQMLYGKGEVTFLSLLQAQRTLTETELAFVEAQAERWSNAVAIADLLQLEVFPPTPAAPAAIEGPVGLEERAAANAAGQAPAAAADKRPPQPLPEP
jgi:cobalt-zinc-cadmium efflux system outer membrane protein